MGLEPRRLIINADDFGLTAGINRAVETATKKGILTSTSVIVAGSHAGDVVRLAEAFPEINIGLHVNFTCKRPSSDPGRVRSLVDAEGQLLSERELLSRILRRWLDTRDVYREVSSQVARLRGLGVEPTHWDAHRAVAFWPGLRGPTAAALKDAGIRRARSPRVQAVASGRGARRAKWQWRLERPRRLISEFDRQLAHLAMRRHFLLPDWRTSSSLVVNGDDHRTR